jgi:uncharacterized protein with beta-barrel porin domain
VQRSTRGDATGYSGGGFGFATGIEGPLNSGGLFGLSAAFTTSTASDDVGASNDDVSASFGQMDAYWAFTTGALEWTVIVGGGAGQARSSRDIAIGEDFRASLESAWSVAEGHATLVGEVPYEIADGIEIAPRVSLGFVSVWEDAHAETGSDLGVEIDAQQSERLHGELGARMSYSGGVNGALVRSSIYGGWRDDLLDTGGERTMRFAGATSSFTLVDAARGEGGGVVGAGVDFLGEWISFGVALEGEFRDGYARQGVNATARIRF